MEALLEKEVRLLSGGKRVESKLSASVFSFSVCICRRDGEGGANPEGAKDKKN